MSLFESSSWAALRERGEAFTVYPIVLVKTSDERASSRKPRVYPYTEEESRWEAAKKFLDGGATIRFEDPYETDGSEFDGKFGER